MADYLLFNEGAQYLLTHGNGVPATSYLLLSTQAIGTLTATSTLAAGVGEITGTGYARQSQSTPAPSAGSVAFSQATWTTSSATNWPTTVITVLVATTSDNTGHVIAAWHLNTGGTPVNMAAANKTLHVTPSLLVASVAAINGGTAGTGTFYGLIDGGNA